MEARYETFTVLIARISRSIRRLKGEEMARWGLKGPHVSCLYYLALSGPMTAAELYMHENPGAQLRVFDSRSAASGETLIAMKIMELEAQGLAAAAIKTRWS